MVITMDIKHVIPRGETYSFRMRVPHDCIKQIGKKEIIQSLKTSDKLEAGVKARKLTEEWTAKFRSVRKPVSPVEAVPNPGSSAEEADAFRQKLTVQMEKNLPGILQAESEDDLQHRLDFYQGSIVAVRENDWRERDLSEIGIHWPLKPSKSPGFDRTRKKILCEVLQLMCEAVAQEMGIGAADSLSDNQPKAAVGTKEPVATPVQEFGIMEVAELMLSAKKRIAKTEATVKADIRLLMEWSCGKRDITAYTKKDLIDFVCNCLPHIPANILKKKEYRGKSLRECVKLTKENPEQYPPISYVTCGNRLVNIAMVFNYAKDQLGIIPVNPAKGIEIPKVRIIDNGPRGFTPDELTAMWRALQNVRGEEARKPSRFWTTVLSLYHGFRLNEVCSLFLKDVYEDEDGVFVIDVNENQATKSVKNQSSVRIVPVHPFVRDQLGFKSFVENQKSARSEGLLFSDLSFIESKGYLSKVSIWFATWKKEWLASEAQYKHFHDLRYTFSQAAQNVAKMPDRHAQEITGHSIEGVSAVHLGYSGRLKPAALLEELQKVKYGWETDPDVPVQ